MRAIRKGKEPRAWTEFRARPGASYSDVDAPKQELREALVREQGGLCCYCMTRIEAKPEAMKIEHWAPQSLAPSRQLDYANLLGACLGGQLPPGKGRQALPRHLHCDSAKGDTPIGINPAEPGQDCTERFVYVSSGEIKASGDDPRVGRDIDVLALNHLRGRAGRREVILEAKRQVVARGKPSRELLLSMASRLEQVDARGNLQIYCQAAIFWLRRQARKREH
ncbi:MAG: TIGR02646 family protein [Myxococcales bacterium]|nr:TIGR02646 family protein [Myxococcales bacterium]